MMRALLLLVAAPLALGGCANTSQLDATLDTLAKNYAACDRTVTYAASVGAMNPGSGAQVQGTIHCPPHNPDGTLITNPAPTTTTTTTTTP